MDLNDFEKDLVRNLNRNGKDTIINIFDKMLKDWEVSISYQSSYFQYNVSKKDIGQQREITKIDPSKDSQRAPKINKYHSYLKILQEKIEESLHLIDLLASADLLIRYSQDIQDSFSFGLYPPRCKDELSVLYCIISKEKCDWANLWISLEKLFGTNIVLLPGLVEFENNNYKTSEELDRKKELQRLNIQTVAVVIGVLVSAVITLIAVSISHPNASDIKTITESINELTVKVDELTPTIIQPTELNVPIMPNIIPTHFIQQKIKL